MYEIVLLFDRYYKRFLPKWYVNCQLQDNIDDKQRDKRNEIQCVGVRKQTTIKRQHEAPQINQLQT